MLCSTLDAVEDEFAGVPNDPECWRTDGRMYPPQSDRSREVDGHPGVIRYESVGHDTFIRDNGAIEVRTRADRAVRFEKAGVDGKGVWG